MISYTVFGPDGTIIQSGTAQKEEDVEKIYPGMEIEFGVARAYVPPHRVLDYAARRRLDYPSIGDQLDALWRGGEDANEMLARIMEVKAMHPKDV